MTDYTKEKVSLDSRFVWAVKGKHIIADCHGTEDSMQRLASCWNACIPFENPESDIPKLIEVLREIIEERALTNTDPLKAKILKALSLVKEIK